MKPVFQTINDPNDGDCLSASIASILELEICDVPKFTRDYGDEWESAAKQWLAARGLRFLSIGFDDYGTFSKTYFANVGEFCLMSGPSNLPDRAHAVVGIVSPSGAIELAHDPNHGGSGPLIGHRWIRFIVLR